MPNIGVLTIELVARAERFEATMNRAQKQLETVVKTGEKLRKTGQSMMLGITAPITLFAGAALKAAGDMEQMQLAFTSMLGSGEKAAKFLDDLARFAEKTPFEYTDLTMQARRLMAFGFAAEDVIPMLTAIGDAVAAMGGSAEVLERVTRALGQMRAKQKVVGEEMLQLTEAGIPAWEYLARAVGKSTPEVMEMTRKGLIPANVAIQALLKGMEEDFGGLMAEQAKTMLGSFSNLQDVIGRFMRTLGESINKTFNLTEKIKALTEWVGKVTDALQNMNPVLRTTVIWLGLAAILTGPVLFGLGMLVKISQVVTSGLALVSKAISHAIFAFAAWKTGAATLGEALVFLVGSRFKLIVLGIGLIVTATILIIRHWNQLVAAAHAVWSTIGAVVLYGASLVVRGVGLILTAISVIIPPIRNAAKAVLGLADSLKSSAAQSLASAKSAVNMAKSGQQAVDNQDKIAKVGEKAAKSQDELAKATEGAAKAAGDNIQSFDEVHQIQEAMADTAVQAPIAEMPDIKFPSLADVGIGDVATQIGQQISRITESASRAWERLRQAMEPVNRAVQWIKDNWPTIGPIIEGIAGVISVLLIPALVKAGIEALISAGKQILAWTLAGAEAVKQAVVIIGQLLLTGAKWAWLGIQATINAGKAVVAWAIQGWEAVKSVAIQVAQFVIAGAKWVWLGVQAGIGTAQVVAAWIVQKAQAVASVAVQVAQFIILGAKWVWMGITAMANAAVMAAAWFVALGPVAWVIATIALVAAIVALNWDWVKTKTIEIWNTVSQWLTAVWDWIKDVAMTVWERIKRYIITPIQTAWGWLETVWNEIGTFLSKVWYWIKDQAISAWIWIKNSIITPMQQTWTWLEMIWNNIGSWLSGKWAAIKDTAVNIWEGMKEAVVDRVSKLKTDAVQIFENLWNYIKGIPSQAIQWGRNIIEGLWNGISGLGSWIYDRVRGFFEENIINPIKSLFRISSPSGLMMDFGGGIASGLAQGIESNSHLVASASQNLGMQVVNPINAIAPTMEDAGKGLVSSLIGGISSMQSSLSNTVRQIEQSLRITVPAPSIPSVPSGGGGGGGGGGGSAWGTVNVPGIGPVTGRITTSNGRMTVETNIDVITISDGKVSVTPKLAEGGVVTRPTLAMVGERGPEAVVPLSRSNALMDSISKALYQAVIDAARIIQATQPADREVVLRVDGVTLARILLPALIREGQRQGMHIVVRPSEGRV